jgi:hypothetical protein
MTGFGIESSRSNYIAGREAVDPGKQLVYIGLLLSPPAGKITLRID